MNIFSSYKVKIKHYNHIFEQTVEIYRNAVSFFIDICDKEWNILEPLRSKEKLSYIEKFTLQTKNNQNPKYNFNERFYKMPSYLRRSAINTATGCYSSYYSNLKNWEDNPVGDRPKRITFARCLDGGGSSTLAIRGELINIPACWEERPVVDYLLFK